MFTMISDRHNCDDGYISLVNVELENAPDKININGKELLKKSEFHVSIMALEHLALMFDSEDTDKASEQLKQDFLDFIQTHSSLTAFTLTGGYRLVTRDERVTVVAMVNMPNIAQLFDYLSQKHNVNFPTQPTHVTIYTLQPDAGIGILSQDEIDRDTTVFTVPELINLQIAPGPVLQSNSRANML